MYQPPIGRLTTVYTSGPVYKGAEVSFCRLAMLQRVVITARCPCIIIAWRVAVGRYRALSHADRLEEWEWFRMTSPRDWTLAVKDEDSRHGFAGWLDRVFGKYRWVEAESLPSFSLICWLYLGYVLIEWQNFLKEVLLISHTA